MHRRPMEPAPAPACTPAAAVMGPQVQAAAPGLLLLLRQARSAQTRKRVSVPTPAQGADRWGGTLSVAAAVDFRPLLNITQRGVARFL